MNANFPKTVVTALGALWLGVQSQPACATVRALFVGVDTYEFSSRKENQFENLKGAVADVVRIKDALRSRYRWTLDSPIEGGCSSENATSITLTDSCAKRDDILGALQRLILQSRQGDTVLFYYAGHGSQIFDRVHGLQASGLNDTILPYDARDPTPGKPPNEIVDDELNVIIENTRNAGVNFVTIFDSCHSKTGTRDGSGKVVRGVSKLEVLAVRHLAKITIASVAAPGYRVHLAAALDSEEAAEVPLGPDDRRAGVFTSALVAAINSRHDATFADLIEDAQLQIHANDQHPQAEAQPSVALQSTFEGRTGNAAVLELKHDGSRWVLPAGRIQAVTAGSTFGLYADRASALDNTALPLVKARVDAVDFDSSSLSLDGAELANSPDRMFARELVHDVGISRVPVQIALLGKNATLQERLTNLIKPLPFAILSSNGRYTLTNLAAPQSQHIVLADGQNRLADLGLADDPSFSDRLTATFSAMARVQDILTLRDGSTSPNLSICVNDDNFPISPSVICPLLAGPPAAKNKWAMGVAKRSLSATKNITLAVTNSAAVKRYVYVLMIENQLDVTLLTPQDAPLEPGHIQRVVFTVSEPGMKQFLVLATETPIAAGLLEQDGARDAASCTGLLERLLCAAGSGTRDPSVIHQGPWGAIVSTVEFK